MISLRQILLNKTRAACILIWAAQLTACATPSQHFAESARDLGFADELLIGERFTHRIYLNHAARQTDGYPELHVYLDGDGTPWENNRRIASDPTARNPLILQLMALDKAPSIVLGRPCYYGLNKSRNCDYRLWTSRRYAQTLVDSLVDVLNNWLLGKQSHRLVLIGFSGGGALAALMASRIPDVRAVITLSANLDTDAWTQYHGFDALAESLNPALQPGIAPDVKQIHFAGENDKNVPAFIIRSYAARQTSARFKSIKDYDHTCCWADQWPDLLAEALDNTKQPPAKAGGFE